MQSNQKFGIINTNGTYTLSAISGSDLASITPIPLNTNYNLSFLGIQSSNGILLTLDLNASTTATSAGVVDVYITATDNLGFTKVLSLTVTGGQFQAPSSGNPLIINNDFPNKINQVSIQVPAMTGLKIVWTNTTSAVTDLLRVSGNSNNVAGV